MVLPDEHYKLVMQYTGDANAHRIIYKIPVFWHMLHTAIGNWPAL